MPGPPFRRLAAAALLFACGALACLAWQAGLFANAAVAALAGMALAAGGLRRDLRRGGATTGSPPRDTLALEAEQRRLKALLDQAPAPLLVLAADGALRAVNRAARSMFATDDRVLRPPQALLRAIQGGPSGERTVLRLPAGPADGAQRSYAVSVAVSAATEGVSRIAVLTDVQAELVAAEARALRDLLQVLGHEIMNSLTPVTSLAESARALLSRGDPADAPRVAEALETIQRRAEGLDRFVQGYRTLSRLPPPVMRPVSVSTVLRDAASLFHARWDGTGVALAVAAPQPDVIARLDPDLIVQALLTLLTNAAEAAVAAVDRSPPQVSLAGAADGGGASFKVADSGAGVPAGQEDAIFQPFFSLKAGGAGIGLGLARQIAAAHGGTLHLEPPGPRGGACFVMRL